MAEVRNVSSRSQDDRPQEDRGAGGAFGKEPGWGWGKQISGTPAPPALGPHWTPKHSLRTRCWDGPPLGGDEFQGTGAVRKRLHNRKYIFITKQRVFHDENRKITLSATKKVLELHL